MPKYLIERHIEGAGSMTEEEWRGASGQSNETIAGLDADVTWVHSYVTPDKLFCVYEAPNEDVICEHGETGGFPVDVIYPIERVIDPSTGN